MKVTADVAAGVEAVKAYSEIYDQESSVLSQKIDTRNKQSVVDVLTAVIDATAYSSVDRKKLVALV